MGSRGGYVFWEGASFGLTFSKDDYYNSNYSLSLWILYKNIQYLRKRNLGSGLGPTIRDLTQGFPAGKFLEELNNILVVRDWVVRQLVFSHLFILFFVLFVLFFLFIFNFYFYFLFVLKLAGRIDGDVSQRLDYIFT